MSQGRRTGVWLASQAHHFRKFIEGLVYAVLTPLLLDDLGVAGYGVLGLAWALTAVWELLGTGLRRGYPTLLEELARKGQRAEAASLRAATIQAAIGPGLIGLAVAMVFGIVTGSILTAPGLVGREAAIFISLAGLRTALYAPLSIHEATNIALAVPSRRTSLSWLTLALETGAVVATVVFDLGLLGLGGLQLVTALVIGLMHRSVSRRLLPPLGAAPEPIAEIMRSLAAKATYHALDGLGWVLIQRIDAALVALLVGLDQVALYVIVAEACLGVARFVMRMTTTLMPTMPRPGEAHDRGTLRHVFVRSLDGGLLAGGAVAVLLWAFGPALLSRWLGVETIDQRLLYAFAGFVVVSAPVSVSWAFLDPMGFGRFRLGSSLLEAVVKVGIAAALSVKYGAVGVAFGTVAGRVLTTAWLTPIYAARKLGIGLIGLTFGRILRLITGIGPALAVAWLFLRFRPPTDAARLVLEVCVTLIVAVVCAFATWTLAGGRAESEPVAGRDGPTK